jgi:hypothetical protein
LGGSIASSSIMNEWMPPSPSSNTFEFTFQQLTHQHSASCTS